MVVTDPRQFDWLASDAGQHYLNLAAAVPAPTIAQVTALRRAIGNDRAHLVLEQIELRHRARKKFTRANQMFFTPQLLEQSSEERIARYKSLRYPPLVPLADLCCGLGGDVLALAQRGPVVAVDRSPLAIRLARANCRALGATEVGFVLADAATFDVGACAAWHIDPDRRAKGHRTSQPDMGQPNPETLQRLIARQAAAGIKLAPAGIAPTAWQSEAELEWIGTRRECRQQVAWFGPLARKPGLHTATVLGGTGQVTTLSGRPDGEIRVAADLQPFVYEPHAAVLAAHLTQEFAVRHGLAAVAPGVAYLTGPDRLSSPLASGFAVVDLLPLDRKRLKAWLRARGIGQVEIKVRGAPIDPQVLRQQLRVSGDHAATLLVVGTPHHVSVILTERIDTGKRP